MPEGAGVLDDSDVPSGGRGPYERAWTTDATRALIHIRGPMEGSFTEGRQKRTALWISVTRQLQKLGFRYSAAKVQKKWHNILITYNKNLSKKFHSGYVHWEFFEEMFKYLQGKKAECDQYSQDDNSQYNTSEPSTVLQPQIQLEAKSADEYEEESSSSRDAKKMKYDYNMDNPVELPLEITHANGVGEDEVVKRPPIDYMPENINGCDTICNSTTNTNPIHVVNSVDWWKEYFERKLVMEREKIELQKEMHRDLMHFNKMSLIQQEKIERIKIDAINNLTVTLQKFVEVKNKKI